MNRMTTILCLALLLATFRSVAQADGCAVEESRQDVFQVSCRNSPSAMS